MFPFSLFKRKKPKPLTELPPLKESYGLPLAPSHEIPENDMQLILSKLDLINARLENLHYRISNIEKSLVQEKPINRW